MYCAAQVMGKKAYIVLNDVTSSLRPMKECFTEDKGYPEDMFIESEEAMELVNYRSVVVVVDTNRPNYTECPELLGRTRTKGVHIADTVSHNENLFPALKDLSEGVRFHPGLDTRHFLDLSAFSSEIGNLLSFFYHYLVSAPAQGKVDCHP